MTNLPPLSKERGMGFIDGENLVLSFQEMRNSGQIPLPGTKHNRDVYVWNPNIVTPFPVDIIRLSYYTAVQGDDETLVNAREEIHRLYYKYPTFSSVRSVGNVVPNVFKKKKGHPSKRVDVSMTTDALVQAENASLDCIYIVTGDADFLPLIEEIMRRGKRVHVAAFSRGLSPQLKTAADDFSLLDEFFFEKA